MRKKMVRVMCIFALSSYCVACQKTPQEQIVVDKSQGIAEESIIPKEEDGIAKDLNIPEYWNETITRKDGMMTLTVDYDIQIEDVYNTPVYEYEIQPMDQELLERLCSYFANGASFYENSEMTKEELMEEKDKMIEKTGNWGYYGENYIQSMVGRIETLIEKAPDEKSDSKEITIGLTVPQETGMELIGKSWYNATHKRTWNDWYYETDKNVGFTARIDTGQEVDPIIRATTYDDEVGSTTAFVYRQGTFIDEKELQLEWDLEKAYEHGNEEYLQYLSDKIENLTDETFTEEDAIREANKVLEELDIQNMVVGDCVKAIGNADSESWAGVGTDDTSMSAGYAVYFSVKAGDVVGYSLTSASKAYEDLTETVYAPSFITEEIRIIVTKDGVQLFEWTNISQQTDVIAENTKLLTFDEIKEKLADHLLYIMVSNLGGTSPEGFTNVYTVKNVQLRAANINAYNNPKAAWLVPVWVFDVECEMNYATTEETTTQNLGPETVVLNAIDGGFVQVPYY